MKEDIPDNLPQMLFRVAAEFPDHGIGYVQADHTIRFHFFSDILEESLSMLAGMQAKGLKKGDVVILSLEKSEEIIPVLWGCFIGGIIPALLQPPVSFTEYNPAADKAEKVFRQLGSPHVILSHEHAENWNSSHIPTELLLDFESFQGDPSLARRAEPGADDLALIQFSSGSTGDPKGVLLTHRNIIVNTTDIIKGIRLEPGDVSVNWMPLYHDMGLIGFHITPVYVGVTQYFLDPVDFVKNPSLWLETMSREKCTITACPNFGQLLVNRYLGRKKIPRWDLSHVRILFNGAEPISVATMRAFLDGLKQFDLHAEAMFPAYGLAEATLAITFPEPASEAEVRGFNRNDLIGRGVAIETAAGDENAMELVNLGRTLDHCEVLVADEHDHAVPEDTVGNVLVKGENVTAGYYGKADVTSAAFHGDWLRTGDLGFLHRGDLYITGRSKDIIFINGMNYYAHDLETVALQLEALSPGKVVISGFFDEEEGHDRLLVFLVGADNETNNALCLRIKNHFATIIGLSAETFILLRSNEIPRTSSGKIQRYKLVERYRKDEYSHIIRL
jgi:acyl-CoA synthetase (AMP-forming)/AMP-acid ligase II